MDEVALVDMCTGACVCNWRATTGGQSRSTRVVKGRPEPRSEPTAPCPAQSSNLGLSAPSAGSSTSGRPVRGSGGGATAWHYCQSDYDAGASRGAGAGCISWWRSLATAGCRTRSQRHPDQRSTARRSPTIGPTQTSKACAACNRRTLPPSRKVARAEYVPKLAGLDGREQLRRWSGRLCERHRGSP